MNDGQHNKDQEGDSAATRKTLQWTTTFLLLAGISTAACILLANAVFGLLGLALSVLAIVKLRGLAGRTGEIGAQIDRMRVIAYVLLGLSGAFCFLILVVVAFVAPAIESYLEAVSPGFNLETLRDALSGGSGSSTWG